MEIEIFADIACPWCYIGEARLDAAIARDETPDVTMIWRPFQLQPQLPATGVPWREFAPQKFGGMDRAELMFAQLTQVGEQDGVTFRFDRVATAANTRDAHRLALLGQARGRMRETTHALFAAYFADGADLNDLATLRQIGAAAGLDAAAVDALLASDELGDAVDASQQEAGALGIAGVPLFIFDRKVAVSGAQPVGAFQRALRQARG